jgi:hypothetical protein
MLRFSLQKVLTLKLRLQQVKSTDIFITFFPRLENDSSKSVVSDYGEKPSRSVWPEG